MRCRNLFKFLKFKVRSLFFSLSHEFFGGAQVTEQCVEISRISLEFTHAYIHRCSSIINESRTSQNVKIWPNLEVECTEILLSIPIRAAMYTRNCTNYRVTQTNAPNFSDRHRPADRQTDIRRSKTFPV